MIRIFSYALILVMISALSTRLKAQMVVDLSTGVDNVTDQPMGIGQMDDTWTGSHYANSGYGPLYCGTGVRVTTGTVFPPGAGPQPHAMWITPFVDFNGNSTHIPAGIAGDYFYKAKFYLWSCPVQSATLNFKLIGGDSFIYYVYFNQPVNQFGSNNSINLYMNPLAVNSMNYNVSITVPTSLLQQGLNEITFEIPNGSGYTGFEADGNLTIEACAFADYKLVNDKGEEKTEFCIDEPSLLSGSAMFPNNSTVELLEDNGSGGGFAVVDTKPAQGLQNGFDISAVFSNLLLHQGPHMNSTYKVRLHISGGCTLDISPVFKFRCCGSSTFNVVNTGSALVGSTPVRGYKEWNIYSFSAGNEGSYTLESTFPDIYNSFRIDGTDPCYYVTLTSNVGACGTLCASQAICNMACEVEPCLLEPPGNFTRAQEAGHYLSWNQVTNADHYLVEVIFNDPACCTSDLAPDPVPLKFTTENITYQLQLPPAESPFPGFPPLKRCYSIRVYAICADGSRSEASGVICVQE